MTPQGLALVQSIEEELRKNGNKLGFEFIKKVASGSQGKYFKLTDNTRVCILVLPTGHEVVGYARVLDKSNDKAEAGNSVALENATDELWSLLGTIAKLFIKVE